MKTIRQIADEIGVSRQAVHKKIKQEPLSTSLQQFTSTVDGTVYIEVDGINLIKTAFGRIDVSTVSTISVDTMSTQLTTILQEQLEIMTEQNRDLREQLNHEREHSRSQSDRIMELASQMAQLANNAQLLHSGDMIPRLKTGFSIETTEDTSPAEESPTASKESDKLGFLEQVKQFFK